MTAGGDVDDDDDDDGGSNSSSGTSLMAVWWWYQYRHEFLSIVLRSCMHYILMNKTTAASKQCISRDTKNLFWLVFYQNETVYSAVILLLTSHLMPLWEN